MNIFKYFVLARPVEENQLVTESMIDRSLKWDTELITDALAHYCHVCKIGFKTRGGTKNHMRIKHHA